HSVEAVLPSWRSLLDEVAERFRSGRSRDLVEARAATPWASEIWGGFESSTHRRFDGRRVDVVASTQHDARALEDYADLGALGMVTVRDGVRWHLVEPRPGEWCFDSLDHQLSAARTVGTQVVWDLLHYGWPDHVDVW